MESQALNGPSLSVWTQFSGFPSEEIRTVLASIQSHHGSDQPTQPYLGPSLGSPPQFLQYNQTTQAQIYRAPGGDLGASAQNVVQPMPSNLGVHAQIDRFRAPGDMVPSPQSFVQPLILTRPNANLEFYRQPAGPSLEFTANASNQAMLPPYRAPGLRGASAQTFVQSMPLSLRPNAQADMYWAPGNMGPSAQSFGPSLQYTATASHQPMLPQIYRAPLAASGGLGASGGLRAPSGLRAPPQSLQYDTLNIQQLSSAYSKEKTQLCKYFRRGVCNRGRGCRFAHGTEELVLDSTLCKYHRAGAICPFNQRSSCDFSHEELDICDYSRIGRRCPHKANGLCRFYHTIA